MKPAVLDCSVALSWCFKDEGGAYSNTALDYVQKHSAIVPSLWAVEMTNVLLSAERKSRIDLSSAIKFLELFAKLPIRISTISTGEIFSEVFKLAHTHKLTSYDACYLYLAIKEKAPLLTLDQDLANAAEKCRLPQI